MKAVSFAADVITNSDMKAVSFAAGVITNSDMKAVYLLQYNYKF